MNSLLKIILPGITCIAAIGIIGAEEPGNGNVNFKSLDLNKVLEEYLDKNTKIAENPRTVVVNLKYTPLLDSTSQEFDNLVKNRVYQSERPYSLILDKKIEGFEIDLYSKPKEVQFVIWTRPLGDVPHEEAGLFPVIGIYWREGDKAHVFSGKFRIEP